MAHLDYWKCRLEFYVSYWISKQLQDGELSFIGFIVVSFELVECMNSSLKFDIEQYINYLRGTHELNL